MISPDVKCVKRVVGYVLAGLIAGMFGGAALVSAWVGWVGWLVEAPASGGTAAFLTGAGGLLLGFVGAILGGVYADE